MVRPDADHSLVGPVARPREERPTLLAAAEAAQADVNRQKEIGLMGQTIAESIWEEGRTKGLSEGRSEGRTEGELKLARRLLRQLPSHRFGTVPETVLQRIDHATDVERLHGGSASGDGHCLGGRPGHLAENLGLPLP